MIAISKVSFKNATASQANSVGAQPFNAFFQPVGAGKIWRIYAATMWVAGDTAAPTAVNRFSDGIWVNQASQQLPSQGHNTGSSQTGDFLNRQVRIDDPTKIETGAYGGSGIQFTTYMMQGSPSIDIPSLAQLFGTFTPAGTTGTIQIVLVILYEEIDACPS